jgi:hypothetical protein
LRDRGKEAVVVASELEEADCVCNRGEEAVAVPEHEADYMCNCGKEAEPVYRRRQSLYIVGEGEACGEGDMTVGGKVERFGEESI